MLGVSVSGLKSWTPPTDLRQFSVGPLEPVDALGDEEVDLPLLRVCRQVQAGQHVGVRVAPERGVLN